MAKYSNGKLRITDYLLKQYVREEVLEILEKYSNWLLKHGYLDADFWAEPPTDKDKTTLDVFLEEFRL